jgi:hypothetical protein
MNAERIMEEPSEQSDQQPHLELVVPTSEQVLTAVTVGYARPVGELAVHAIGRANATDSVRGTNVD